MAETYLIAYHPEFARLPDAQGNPIGTDAALLLSQCLWLSQNRAGESGWFEFTLTQCEEQTGLTRRQQQRLFPLMESLRLIKTDRRGENGTRHIRLCEGFTPNVQTGKHETCKPKLPDEKGLHQTCKPESTKRVNRFTPNVQTEPDLFLIKETKTRDNIIPPIIPPKSGSARNAFLPPSEQEILDFVLAGGGGTAEDASAFFDHFSSVGWLVSGKTPMQDWKAAFRNWVRRSQKWATENASRGSPRNGHIPPPPKQTHEQRLQEEREAVRQIYARRDADGRI